MKINFSEGREMDFNEYEVIAEDTGIYWNAEIRGGKLIIRIARKDKFEEWDTDGAIAEGIVSESMNQ